MLDIVRSVLFTPYGLDDHKIATLLSDLRGPGINYADFYFQYLQSESWLLEDGIVKEASFTVNQGVGTRAVSGVKTGLAYSDEISIPALKKSISAAHSIIANGKEGSVPVLSAAKPVPNLYTDQNPLTNYGEAEKVSLLQNVYAEIMRQDPRIVHVMLSLNGSHEMILVVNNEGHLACDIRPLIRLSINVVISDQGRRERGTYSGGGRVGYEYFTAENRALNYAREAVRVAQVNLKAMPSPAGNMPVVLGPGWPGVLLHEAVGHGLEGDFNRKKSSIFSDRIGEKVATSVCTVVDHGNLEGHRRGSSHIDDEGTPTQCTVLIENGILKSYMQDQLNARLMNAKLTGNGRRESFASIPIPRMTNTYILAGTSAPEEIIASVDKGIYAVNFSGGQVDITSGNFVFTTSEAYLIEKGKITQPIKDAALVGSGPEVLTKISMVGNDLALDPGVGTCGKDGQGVPVGVGQPTLRVDELTVGGSV